MRREIREEIEYFEGEEVVGEQLGRCEPERGVDGTRDEGLLELGDHAGPVVGDEASILVVEKDILGLDIGVDDAKPLEFLDALGYLEGDPEFLDYGELSLVVVEVLLEVLSHQVGEHVHLETQVLVDLRGEPLVFEESLGG